MSNLVPLLDPKTALAFEKEMLESVATKDFRFATWQTTQCLVAPKSLGRHPDFETAQTLLRKQGWPIFLRSTGGDVTPQGQGILNISLAYCSPQTKVSIKQTYIDFCTPMLSLLNEFGLDAYCSSVKNSFCDGAFNIVIEGKKLAGTAQRWKQFTDLHGQRRKAVFIHALILIDADIEAACSAIHQLYEVCQMDKQIRSDVHVNLESLVKPVLELNAFGEKIEQYYSNLR